LPFFGGLKRVWSKPVGGGEQGKQGKQGEQGELKFVPTTYDHTSLKQTKVNALSHFCRQSPISLRQKLNGGILTFDAGCICLVKRSEYLISQVE